MQIRYPNIKWEIIPSGKKNYWIKRVQYETYHWRINLQWQQKLLEWFSQLALKIKTERKRFRLQIRPITTIIFREFTSLRQCKRLICLHSGVWKSWKTSNCHLFIILWVYEKTRKSYWTHCQKDNDWTVTIYSWREYHIRKRRGGLLFSDVRRYLQNWGTENWRTAVIKK